MSYLGANPSIDAFTKWTKKENIFLHPDIAFLVPTKTMGMGVFARKPLPAGTVVISCPSAASICPYEAPSARAPSVALLQQCYILAAGGAASGRGEGGTVAELTGAAPAAPVEVRFIDEAHDHSGGYVDGAGQTHTATNPAFFLSKYDPVLFVVLRLMAELCRPKSPWRPWLEACPRMPHHFFQLTDAQQALLLRPNPDTRAHLPWTGVSEQLTEVRAAARWDLAQRIMAPHASVWPPEEATAALFWECLAHVLSRNFHREELVGREGPYLLPGLDILNHNFDCNTKFEVRGGGRKHEAAFTVVTTRPLQKGEQVYVTYGRIGAARFAVEFQFVNERIQAMDSVRFSAPVMVDLATCLRQEQDVNLDVDACRQEMARRVDYLQRLGIVYDEGLYLSRPHDLQLAPPPPGDDDDDNNNNKEEMKIVLEQARLFAAVFYLLVGVAGKEDFTNLYKTINKFWAAPKVTASGPTKALVAAVLSKKVAAVQAQKEKVDATFAGAKEDAVRRQLLHRALQSELDTLAFFQKWILAR